METKETVNVMSNGLSPSENRIRLLVEKNMDDVIEGFVTDFNAALNETADAVKLMHQKLQVQATNDFQNLNARLREIEKRQEYEAARARMQSASTTSSLPVSPALINLKVDLDRTIPTERHDALFAEMSQLLKGIDGAKTTYEVQRLLYRAGDEASRYAGKKGPARSCVHFSKRDVIINGGALLAAGVAIGVAGTLTARTLKSRRSKGAPGQLGGSATKERVIDTTAVDVPFEVVHASTKK